MKKQITHGCVIHMIDREIAIPSNRLHIICLGCETGTYGINCSRTCGHCENSETCDIDDGKCDMDGCAKPGYEPPSCNSK